MESSSKDRTSLHCLPVELLEMIIRLLSSTTSLKPLSTVNRVFRQLCVPFIFRTLRISCSTSGLNCLVEASHCSIAPYVKAIRYEISERIDPRTKVLMIRSKKYYWLYLLQSRRTGNHFAHIFTPLPNMLVTEEVLAGRSKVAKCPTPPYIPTSIPWPKINRR